jgi:hypothetical protein
MTSASTSPTGASSGPGRPRSVGGTTRYAEQVMVNVTNELSVLFRLGVERAVGHGEDTSRHAAAMNANVWDAGDAIERLLQTDRPIDPARLADPDAELFGLAGSPGA